MVLILLLNVLYGRLPRTTLTDWFCITEVDSVYCAVRIEPLYKADMLTTSPRKNTLLVLRKRSGKESIKTSANEECCFKALVFWDVVFHKIHELHPALVVS